MKQEIRCNSCGKLLGQSEEKTSEDYLYVTKEWGYFSGKDGLRQEWRLCEECYDRLLEGFSIPAEEEEVTELI